THFCPTGGLDLTPPSLGHGHTALRQRTRGRPRHSQTRRKPAPGPEQATPANGSFSGGDMPHAWAAASYVTLVREMMLSERGDALELLSGVPDWWLADGRTISVKGAPTHFGALNLRTENELTQSEAGWNGTLTLTLSGAAPPDGFRWRLPVQPYALSGPSGTKTEAGWLIVPPEEGKVRLTFAAQP
ncbi:MAG TPA: hypothetical protein QGI30_05675, partial [Anaerolineales bacterium]|nr:hypothetical protein [Anaerolineales bacterium]